VGKADTAQPDLEGQLIWFWRNGMQQARASLLHLQNAIDQIPVAGLFGKRQGSFEAIPLQRCSEFSLPQHNHPGM